MLLEIPFSGFDTALDDRAVALIPVDEARGLRKSFIHKNGDLARYFGKAVRRETTTRPSRAERRSRSRCPAGLYLESVDGCGGKRVTCPPRPLTLMGTNVEYGRGSSTARGNREHGTRRWSRDRRSHSRKQQQAPLTPCRLRDRVGSCGCGRARGRLGASSDASTRDATRRCSQAANVCESAPVCGGSTT